MSRDYWPPLLAFILLFEVLSVSAVSGDDLVVNGGFESQFDGWEPYVYYEGFGLVDLTSGTSHSSNWSLRTYVYPTGKCPYARKRGGGVKQVLSSNVEDLDMLLDFWVMPAIVGQNSYTNIRSTIHMELKDGRSLNISYYLAWAPPALGEFLYNTSYSTIFFLPAQLHQWSNVQREIKDDFESRFGNPKGIILSQMWIILEMTTVSHLTTPDAFWDDIRVAAKTPSQTSSSPAQIMKPQSNPQPSSATPPLTSITTTSMSITTERSVNIEGAVEGNGILILLLLTAISGMAAIGVRKAHAKGSLDLALRYSRTVSLFSARGRPHYSRHN